VALLADFRYSAKSLARTPGLTVALLLTIALGIGSNAAVFGFIRGLVARDLPLPGIETAVSVFAHDSQGAPGPVSYERYLVLKTHVDALESLGVARETRETVVIDGRASVMSVAAVTPELADVLRLSLAGGAVISHRTWQAEFGGKASARGSAIQVGGVQSHVAGVAPDWLEGLYMGRAVDVWAPLLESSLQGADRASRTFWTLGRLRPGRSIRQAESEINAAGDASAAVAIQPYTGLGPEAGSGMARLATLLPAAAAAVFVIACANVAAFLLSRASSRSQETAVRVALGASRGQLGRQLLADSVLLSLAGGACGVLLASWTLQIIPALFFDQDAEHLVLAPNIGGIVIASVACAVITIACGLLPLVEVRDDDPALVLRRESVGPSLTMQRVRAGLVVAQMACCCLLIVSTVLLLEGFRAALKTTTGARLGRPILATLKAHAGFGRPDLGLQYFRDAERAALTMPGIYETAWVGTPPGSRATWQSIRVEPQPLKVRDAVMTAVAFTPHMLKHIGTSPVKGRLFSGADKPESCRVAVINEDAADRFFNGNAIGRSIEDLSGQRVEIVGVVGTPAQSTAALPAGPAIYFYPQQTGMTPDQGGPATFRVPLYAEPEVTGVVDANIVSRGYFAAMDVAPVAGQVFFDEPEPGGCRVGVVNQEAAELYFGGRAVGGAVIDPGGIRTNIVGVVHSAPLRATQRSVEPTIYFPLGQDYQPLMTLILGTQQDGRAIVTAVRHQLETVGGGETAGVLTLEAHLGRTALASERIAAMLIAASAAIALTLGVLGIYGSLTDFTRRRRPEIALRIALGAQRWRVMLQVLREGARLAGIGLIAGSLASVPVARWLARITPEAGLSSAWVWLAAPLVMILAVGVASVLPMRRALAVNPLSVMKDN
jgi:putative ABC transport system permease protein